MDEITPPKGVLQKQTGKRDKRGQWIGTKGAFFEIEYGLMMKHLSPSAWAILSLFLFRRQKRKVNGSRKEYETVNKREIVLTYEAAKADSGIRSDATIRNCIDELIEKGLIDLVHQGGGLKGNHSVYGLSDRYKKYDPDPDKRNQKGFIEKRRGPALSHVGFQNGRQQAYNKRRPKDILEFSLL